MTASIPACASTTGGPVSTSYSFIAVARVLGVLVSSMLITPIPQHTNAVAASASQRAPAKSITPPVQLRALAFTAREVELSWRAAPDAATSYEVTRDGQVLGEFPASTGAYVDRLAPPVATASPSCS